MTIRQAHMPAGEMDLYFAYTSANAWPFDYEKKIVVHFIFEGKEYSKVLPFVYLHKIGFLSYTEEFLLDDRGDYKEHICPMIINMNEAELFFTNCPKKKAMVKYIQACLELYDDNKI